ncbi:MAG: serine hydrolase, partial [Pseudomonadota bacterium]|nr:serine hydrolase [Pseudomonadota bacterium]
LSDGADDGVTLTTVSGKVAGPLSNMAVRVRSLGNASNDTCWADNIRVTLETAIPSAEEGAAALEQILDGQGTPSTILPMSVFEAPSDNFEAEVEWQGTLSFTPEPESFQARIVTDQFGFAGNAGPQTRLPDMQIEVIRAGDMLVPVRRHLEISSNAHWDYIVTAGRMWPLESKPQVSRAVLPFALIEKNANCTHNGLLVVDIKADDSVSPAYWQIASETCSYFQFDAWGLMSASLDSSPVDDAQETVASFRREIDARLEIKPIGALDVEFPGIDPAVFGSAEDIDPEDMTLFGLVHRRTHYVGGCETRAGDYPYCDALVIPSYSLAKSIFGGFGLMRLEQLHPGARNALVVDYVPACAREGSWGGVTFENLLDMASGHYLSAEPDADEAASVDQEFFLTSSHDQKLDLACRQFPRKADPGSTFVYHTSDTYLLGTAMQAFLEEKSGPQADVYRDLLAEGVWSSSGLSSVMSETRRSINSDGQADQAFAGWGLFMLRSDLAKIVSTLSQNDVLNALGDELDTELLAEALQRDPGKPGLPAAKPPLFYQNGFWAFDIQTYGDCVAPTRIPFMSGFGGLVAAMLPNGVGYYYVSDGGAFRWARAALETEHISKFCTGERP